MFNSLLRSFYIASVLAGLMLMTPSPLVAKEPPGIRELLKTASANEDRATFDQIVALSMDTWPGDITDILVVIEDVRPDWLQDTQKMRLKTMRDEKAAAEQRERDRGIWYYVDPKYWSPKLELGAGTATGDTQENSISLGISLDRKFGTTWEHSLDVRFDYAERQSVTTRERLDIMEESLWRVFEKGYATNFTQVEFDTFSGFDWRVTEVLGVTYDVMKGDKQSLRLSGGPGLRFSRVQGTEVDGLVVTPAVTRQEFIGRLGARYSLKLGDGITFSENLAAVFGGASVRLDSGAVLSAQINSSLSARLRFDVVYESDVPVGTSEVDTVTRATLVYTF